MIFSIWYEMCYTNDVDDLSDMLLSCFFFFFNGNVYITIYINMCKRYRAIVNHTWQYVHKYLCRPPQKLATRLAEAVETRGGKAVFKIQPFVLFVLIFVFYHVSCV